MCSWISSSGDIFQELLDEMKISENISTDLNCVKITSEWYKHDIYDALLILYLMTFCQN